MDFEDEQARIVGFDQDNNSREVYEPGFLNSTGTSRRICTTTTNRCKEPSRNKFTNAISRCLASKAFDRQVDIVVDSRPLPPRPPKMNSIYSKASGAVCEKCRLFSALSIGRRKEKGRTMSVAAQGPASALFQIDSASNGVN
jgi:hypothetical protein